MDFSALRKSTGSFLSLMIHDKRFWYGSIAVMYIVIFIKHMIIPVSHDFGGAIYFARRILEGDKLYVDLIELNPPIIYLISTIPVFFSKLLGINEIISGLIFIFLLTVLSLYIARKILAILFDNQSDTLGYYFLFLLSFVLLFVPNRDFGQREHVMVIFCVPYVVASMARSIGKKIPSSLGWIIGIMAGLGFVLKPHFLLLWIAVEVFLLLTKKQTIRSFFTRSDTYAVISIHILFALMLIFVFPEYFKLASMAMQVYDAYNSRMHFILKQFGPTGFLLIASLTAHLLYGSREDRGPLSILLIAAAVFGLTGISQQKGWTYHFYPGLTFGVLYILLFGVYALRNIPATGSIIWQGSKGLALGIVILLIVGKTIPLTALDIYKVYYLPPQLVYYLSDIAKKYAQDKPIYCLSTSVFPAFPVVNYSNSWFASRFPFLAFLPGCYSHQMDDDFPLYYHHPSKMKPIEKFVFEGVIKDLLKNRPVLLFVDVKAEKQGFSKNFDFLKYFSQDPRFNAMMRDYHLVHQVGPYDIYLRMRR